MRRSHAGLVAAPALAAISLACNRPAKIEAKSVPERGVPVAIAKVAREDLSRELEIAAEFRAWQEIELHAKVAGYVKSINVDVGDRVRRGELLAELEAPEMAQEFAQATAAEKRTELEVARAEGDVKRAESAYKIRKLSYERLASVVKARPNLVAQQEIDDLEARYREAEAQLAAAKAALAATREQVRATAAVRARVGTINDYLRITAPFSGLITKRYADPGAMIQAGIASQTQAMPVVRLSQIDHLRLVLPVPESIVARVRVGSPVEVRVESLRRVFQGRVSRFTGRVETATRTMETEVDIPNPGGVLMPGMYAYATLALERRGDVLSVPVQAISPAKTALVVTMARTLEQRTVETGLETPEKIEVISGLEEGDSVVVGNRSGLRAGQKVEPKPVALEAGRR
jgi:RND family efflux transporter MFP subunit